MSSCIGPRGDAYADLGPASADEAFGYHMPQVEVLADSGVDLVSALTLTNVADAIATVDDGTDAAAAYFMINCADPDHFARVFDGDDPALDRVRGVRANASRLSHAEPDESTELDDGDPEELGVQIAALHSGRPRINVLGGCCGTDARHIAAIAHACQNP